MCKRALRQGVSRAWGALDDVVMGGRSESGFELRRGAGEDGGTAGVFSGTVRTRNSVYVHLASCAMLWTVLVDDSAKRMCARAPWALHASHRLKDA